MVIRRIQLKNNLYLDERQAKNRNNCEPLGEYCVFGYFDAMSIDKRDKEQAGVWKVLSEGIIRDMDGSCSVRSLLCASGDEEKDERFWQADTQKSSFPLLFVSIIRLKEPLESDTVKKEMDELNQSETSMAYLSYEHSELIVFFKTNQYSQGHDFCETLHNIFQIYKMYTIFSVKEEILTSYDSIEKGIIEERVDCRLRAIVKDWSKLQAMGEKLGEALKEKSGFKPVPKERHMMGNVDVMFEINDVSIHRLLNCYKTGRLLTHSNPDYQDVFYNVETEILFAGGKNEGGRD